MNAQLSRRRFAFGCAALAAGAPLRRAAASSPRLELVDLGNGIRLHYVEQGAGAPLVFVHGSLSDYTYWGEQFPFFSRSYRAIAYSRRYNWPNHNPSRPDYSAIADADDLDRLIGVLRLERPIVIGHSYGALAALFLAIRHPRAARALVLAEPPAVSLLNHIPPPQTAEGRMMFADIERRMVSPMRAAFARHEREKGVAAFIDYVFGNPKAWENFSSRERADTMKDAHEWDVMMTSGRLFPDLSAQAVRDLDVPVLMFSGAQSYPFLRLIDLEIARLIPRAQNYIIPGAGHQMWLQKGDFCRSKTRSFLEEVLARRR